MGTPEKVRASEASSSSSAEVSQLAELARNLPPGWIVALLCDGQVIISPRAELRTWGVDWTFDAEAGRARRKPWSASWPRAVD